MLLKIPAIKKLLVIILIVAARFAEAQAVNAAYVQQLYSKYPVKKSRFCPNCYLWDNPYFKTLADVGLHQSIVTYGKFTRQMEARIEQMKKKREGHSAVRGICCMACIYRVSG